MRFESYGRGKYYLLIGLVLIHLHFTFGRCSYPKWLTIKGTDILLSVSVEQKYKSDDISHVSWK